MSNKNRNRRSSPNRATTNRIEAEATGSATVFVFRGVTLTVNWSAVPLQRSLLALRLATNENLSADRRVQYMVDIYEHVLGADQLATLYDVHPDILTDGEACAEFWDGITQAIHGLPAPK